MSYFNPKNKETFTTTGGKDLLLVAGRDAKKVPSRHRIELLLNAIWKLSIAFPHFAERIYLSFFVDVTKQGLAFEEDGKSTKLPIVLWQPQGRDE